MRFATPEAQGRMLCIWCRTYIESAEEIQEDAIIKLLQNVQSQQEYHEICEHMDLKGKKVSAREGDRMIRRILDGTQNDIFRKWRQQLPIVAQKNGPVQIVTQTPFPKRNWTA